MLVILERFLMPADAMKGLISNKIEPSNNH